MSDSKVSYPKIYRKLYSGILEIFFKYKNDYTDQMNSLCKYQKEKESNGSGTRKILISVQLFH